MRKLVKGIAGIISVGILSLLAITLAAQIRLPDDFHIDDGEEYYLNESLSVTKGKGETPLMPVLFNQSGQIYTLNIGISRTAAAKPAQVQISDRKMVVPGGTPFGIKMFTEGVIVVGMTDIQVGSDNINPAKNAGLKIGDILISIDDTLLSRNEDVARCVTSSGGNEIKISLKRGDTLMEAYLKPVQTEYDSKYRAGIWVRDSSAGIGTLTFFDPQTMGFAGLGHAVCDIDTGRLMPLSSGEICDVNISGINPGQSGKPGELRGSFSDLRSIGVMKKNTELGVFGTLNYANPGGDAIPMAYKNEIEPGPAYILATISGNKPRQFAIDIEKINYADSSGNKNMVIKVTDSDLLAATGGIVQGMSGSPIIQNGRLAGAVTHVFVNDPSRGYAIFAENMDAQLRLAA